MYLNIKILGLQKTVVYHYVTHHKISIKTIPLVKAADETGTKEPPKTKNFRIDLFTMLIEKQL